MEAIHEPLLTTMMLIFCLTAIAASVGMYLRQPLTIVYMVLGCVIGPFGLGWIGEVSAIEQLGHIGIVFLLFTVGLDMPTNRIKSVFKQSILTMLASSGSFFAVGMGLGVLFGFDSRETLITALAMVFSSTVVGIKLLPRTPLHHEHIGEVMLGILILQDVIAVIALVCLGAFEVQTSLNTWLVIFGAPPLIIVVSLLVAKFIFWPLQKKFDVVNEYVFLLFIGWCMGIAYLAHSVEISFEIGAFIAGVALANTGASVSQSIAEIFEPLQDFFLVLFFFYVGTTVNPALLFEVAWQVCVLGLVIVVVKPVVFRYLLGWQGEDKRFSWEAGFRLGQNSEFALLILYVAAGQMSEQAALIVLGATVLSLLISSYLVVFNFKNPIALKAELRVH
ncbi:MAG: cation:proton antiporter [Gammaproteobacteria bacterium]|nr:cation:proton antiporter [Gammaproteobacteria bacterium]MDE0251845.1 cation:proton antiporter [Gammaproteobacteria bacterium]